MNSLSKRLDAIEKIQREIQREIQASNFLDAVIIRSDEDLEAHKGKIGPDTHIIKIVPRLQRVGNG